MEKTVEKLLLHSVYGMIATMHEHEEESRKILTDQIALCNTKREIPETWDDSVTNITYMNLQTLFTNGSGFSLVSSDWVNMLNASIIKNRPCFEVMAGSGMLSRALQNLGVDCAATDINDWANLKSYEEWKRPFTEIEELDCIKAVEKYGKDRDFLIMSWPPYLNDIAYKTLVQYKDINPKGKIIYIGEDYGGCTATDEFFDEMEKYEVHTPEEVNNLYKSWFGIHDRIYVIE